MYRKFRRIWRKYITRKAIQLGAAGIWLLLLVVLGTLFRQNIEQFSTKHGLDNFFSNGFEMIVGTGMATYLVWTFWLVTGVAGTLWIDTFLRKRVSENETVRRRERLALVSPKRVSGRVFYTFSDDDFQYEDLVVAAQIEPIAQEDMNILSPEYNANIYRVIIEFSRPINDPAIILVGERTGAYWMLEKVGKTYIHLKIRGALDKYEFIIEFAENASEGERFEINKWYNPIMPRLVHTAPVLPQDVAEDEDEAKSENQTPESPQDIESETQQ